MELLKAAFILNNHEEQLQRQAVLMMTAYRNGNGRETKEGRSSCTGERRRDIRRGQCMWEEDYLTGNPVYPECVFRFRFWNTIVVVF